MHDPDSSQLTASEVLSRIQSVDMDTFPSRLGISSPET